MNLAQKCAIGVISFCAGFLTVCMGGCDMDKSPAAKAQRVGAYKEKVERMQILLQLCDNNGGIDDITEVTGAKGHHLGMEVHCSNGLSSKIDD